MECAWRLGIHCFWGRCPVRRTIFSPRSCYPLQHPEPYQSRTNVRPPGRRNRRPDPVPAFMHIHHVVGFFSPLWRPRAPYVGLSNQTSHSWPGSRINQGPHTLSCHPLPDAPTVRLKSDLRLGRAHRGKPSIQRRFHGHPREDEFFDPTRPRSRRQQGVPTLRAQGSRRQRYPARGLLRRRNQE